MVDTDSHVGADAIERAPLEAVYRRHHAFVWRSVRRLGVHEAAVDDAVHETFMVVARRLHEFEGRADVRTWLFAIALRVVRNHKRAQFRHERRTEALAAEPTPLPRDAYARSDAARALHALLHELTEDQRAAFILAELEGLSAPEIAESLEANVNTIYARIRAARQKIHEAAAELRAAEANGDANGDANGEGRTG